MIKNVLLVGATSRIAEVVARVYAAQGAKLFLVGRKVERLNVIATDLLVRGAREVDVFAMDANETSMLSTAVDEGWRRFARLDIALICQGTLPDQARCERDLQYAVAEFRTNAESVIAALSVVSSRMVGQGGGTVAVIGSVAGDRGRASNYFYGAAKGAVDTFCSGLRARVSRRGVHVLLIKPGFVDTPMTAGLALPRVLLARPEQVASDIVRAIEKSRDVLYTPWFWRYIMFLIKNVPNVIFNRMKL